MNEHILLIEDERAIALPLAERLKIEGYRVQTAFDGWRGYKMGIAKAFDLIILDLTLPRKHGLDVCRDLREAGVLAPILVLSTRVQVADKVVSLKLGADDYLVKPFDILELVARVEALLRRAPTYLRPASSFRTVGSLRIDLNRFEVWRNQARLTLSPKEFQLLRYFIERPDKAITREELLGEVWGYDRSVSTRTVDVHIGWLRQKIELNPRMPELIETVVGTGYRLAPQNRGHKRVIRYPGVHNGAD